MPRVENTSGKYSRVACYRHKKIESQLNFAYVLKKQRFTEMSRKIPTAQACSKVIIHIVLGGELTYQPQAEHRPTILMADDDEDDRFLIAEAVAEAQLDSQLQFVRDGIELLDYLYRRAPFTDEKQYPWPDLILLDLNMPRKDGREVLAELKGDRRLSRIPVLVLTTSREERDVVRAYDLGANSFIVKPVSFSGLVHVVDGIKRYWFKLVSLPQLNSTIP